MEIKVDLTSLELFVATNREKAIRYDIAHLIEEAIEKSGNKDRIAELLLALDRNNKANRNVYFVLGER